MKKQWMKALSFVLALVMVVSLAPVSFVRAEETETTPAGEASSTYEPWGHGYRFVDVLSWDPETDPYSDELVAEVPLQERNETYAPTQSNPDLTDRAKLYAISSSNYRSTDVNEAPWNAGMAYDEFSYGLFKFWQYTDMTGAGGRPTAGIQPGAADKEYGTIAIPMAAGTNAAHKNGVLSIAEYFLPRNPQYTEEWLYQAEDGSFPYADKLIEIMEYYGFDGYFINQEEAIPAEYVPRLKEVMQYMMDKGAYIQWYDSITNSGSISYQNIFNSTNSDFVYDTTHGYGQVSHSIFLNYWYKADAIKDSAEHAESLGLDPYETVYMGLEGGEWRFGIDLEAFWDIMYDHDRFAGNLMQEDGQPYTSFAIWGSDFYREQYNKADNNRYKVEYQWEADERERMYFTSPSELVGNYETENIDRSDIGFTYEDAFDAEGNIVDGTKLGTQTNFKGISRYVVEKSVVNGTVFATDFNTGHGLEYRLDGQVVRDTEWSNFNLQDILPTWQWWITAEGEVTLDMDYDFGPKYERVQGEFPYTQIGAYNGGNSLVIYGNLQAEQLVNLYKTELEVADTTKLHLTYNHVSAADASVVQAALALKVDEETVEMVYVPVEKANEQAGWVTAALDLSAYAGRTIAAIGLTLSSETAIEGYQLNVGRLELTDGADYTPAAPENVHMELNLTGTGEMQVAWDLADYDTVKNYHVYAVYADGSYRFVGGAYADEYYVSSLENPETVVALEVRAVGADGSESEGVRVAVNTGNTVTDILTVSENGKLNVTWNEDGSFESVEVGLSYWYSDKTAPETVTIPAGTKAASFDIALEDGAQYVLTLTTVNADGTKNEPVHYFGTLADHYAEPYVGEARLDEDGKYNLTTPTASDWYSMTVEINGSVSTHERFGGTALRDITVPDEGITTMTMVITDISGNVSEPVTKLFVDGVEVALDGTYEALIPDEALREALAEQVGTTVEDLLTYKGKLDLSGTAVASLSGLNLMTNLTVLDVTDTGLDFIEAINLPTSLVEVIAEDNASLIGIILNDRPNTKLTLGELPALVTLFAWNYGNHGLNLTGAPNLDALDLTGTQLTELDITANTALDRLLIGDSQIAVLKNAGPEAYTNAYYWVWDNAKLDLTETTSEGKLYLGMKDYFANAVLEERIYPSESALYFDGASQASGGAMELVMTVDNGWTHELTSVSFVNQYNTPNYYCRYNALAAEVYVSDDGETWELVGSYEQDGNWSLETIADYDTVTIELTEGTRGKYVKLVIPDVNDGTNLFVPDYQNGETALSNGYPYINSIAINGYFIMYTGFTYAGQQPTVTRQPINKLTLPANGENYQTLELLDAHYASAATNASGTLLRDIEGAEWLDEAYVQAEAYRPAGVRVAITADDGSAYIHPNDTLGAVLPEKVAVNLDNVYVHAQNNNEEGWRLFDGLSSTKWCGGDGGAMWLAFELADGPAVLSNYFTLHAGSESKDYIAAGYRLQYLNPEKVTEEAYLALDADGKKAIARDASNWIDLSVVSGNSENEVATEIPMESLVSAQVYRFQVDQSGQPGKQTWGALRIYEMELYAFEGTLDCVTNGLLKANVPGTYTVTYNVAGAPVNQTTVEVEKVAINEVYDDMQPGTWYYEAVEYMVANGLMKGMSNIHFGPELTLNRAQLTTILHRMAGSPAVEALDNPFVDVQEGSWYYDGFLWCYYEGIVVGKATTIFDPSGLVSRAEMVTMLHRYAGKPEADAEALNAYTDAETVPKFARNAFAWAIENGIVNGMGNNELQPFTTANRAQIAVILARYLQK